MKEADTTRLDALIADYLDELDQGREVPPQQFVAEHPELREPFLRFAAQHTQMNGLARAGELPDESSSTDKTPQSAFQPNDADRPMGSYRLIRCLGNGGMSVVYEATAPGAAEAVALKMLHASAASDSGMRQRFRREVETIRSLNHEHIVPLRDFGTHEGTSFLAMQLIDGETVAHQIRRSAREATQCGVLEPDEDLKTDAVSASARENEGWTMPEKASAIANIADALHHAHSRGVVHRDVKPSNLLIDSQRKVWLTDFGLASAGEAQTVLTRTGQVIGTPHYMSPEQAAGNLDQLDYRSDVYSLGASLYEWVTLERPYQGDPFRVLLEIATGRLRPPSKLCPGVPPSLEAIILKAMSFSPADRYASADELASDLRRFSSGRPIHARRPGPADHAVRWVVRNPKTSIASAIGFAAAVLAVMLTQYRAGQRLSTMNARLAASTQTLEHTNTELANSNRSLFRTQSELRRHLYVADMASAYRAYAQRDVRAVQQLLAKQDPGPANRDSNVLDQRGFEWWLLKNLSRPPEVLTLAKHDGPATELAISPTGNEVFSVGGDGWIRHGDILSGRQLHQWYIGGSLNAIAIAPDGSQLVTGSNVPDGLNTVTLRSTRTGEVVEQLQGHEYSVESAAFSSDGNWIATAGRYHEVILHSRSGQLQGRLMTGSRNESLGFSPDGQHLVAIQREEAEGARPQTLRAWTVPHLEPARSWTLDFDPNVFAFSGNGKQLIAASPDHWAVVRWSDQEISVRQDQVRGRIRCVAMDDDGRRVAAGCDNGLIYVWQIESGENKGQLPPPRTITAGDQKITSIAFLQDHSILASREDGTLQTWSLQASPVEHPTFGLSTREITSRPADSDRLFLRGDHGGIERFNLSTLEHKQIARVESDEHHKLAVTPDGMRIVAASVGQLVVISAIDGSELHRIDHGFSDKTCRGLLFIDNGRHLLALFNDRFRQYETADWSMTDEIMLPNEGGENILASPDDSLVLIRCRDSLLCYDKKSLQRQDEYSSRFGQFTVLSYAASGQTIAVGHQDGTIELLSAPDLEPIGSLQGHRNSVFGLTFIDDDRTLVSSSQRGKIRLWDVRSGREIGGLDIGETSASLLHFSQPLQQLFTFGPHRPGKVWSGQHLD